MDIKTILIWIGVIFVILVLADFRENVLRWSKNYLVRKSRKIKLRLLWGMVDILWGILEVIIGSLEIFVWLFRLPFKKRPKLIGAIKGGEAE